ncbi:MAG: tetratricopeptide repeat protein [Caldilineaceae bacterium]
MLNPGGYCWRGWTKMPLSWPCLAHASVVQLHMGMHDEAIHLAQEALAIYEQQVDDVGIARVRRQLGQVALLTGDYTAATHHLPAALALAQSTGMNRLEADCLDALGSLYWNQGAYGEAQRYFEQARQRYQDAAVANRQGEANALNNLGFVAWSQGDYATAQRYHAAALQDFRQIGNRQGEGAALSSLGRVMERQGDFAAAAEHYHAALELAQSSGDRQGEAITLSNLGFLAYHRGHYAQAGRHFTDCLACCRAIGFRRYEAVALACLSLLAYLLGDNDPAEMLARQALQIGQESADPTLEAYGWTHLGHVLLARQQPAAAQTAYAQGFKLRQNMDDDGRAQEPLAGLAECALALGDLAAAQAHVEQILAYLQHSSLERTLIVAPIYWICYRVCHAVQHPQAPKLLNTAYAILRTRAAALPDEESRRIFLHDVAMHHAVIVAAQAELSR